MSPRAAWRLEGFGFQRVFDFVGGKAEWLERAKPTEGTGPFRRVAGQGLQPPTATCRLDTPAGQVRSELTPGADSICAVINEVGVVLGRVRWKDIPENDDTPVEQFMQNGPATIRPREDLHGLVQRMRSAGVKTILVTTPRGRLLGTVNRDEAERWLRARASAPRLRGEDVT